MCVCVCACMYGTHTHTHTHTHCLYTMFYIFVQFKSFLICTNRAHVT